LKTNGNQLIKKGPQRYEGKGVGSA